MYFEAPVTDISITSVAGSILKAYYCPTRNQTLPELDCLLGAKSANVCLMLLDGLGYNILMDNTDADSFLRRNFIRSLSSVFPPTTAAAATALETGLFPSQTGWLGWTVFWEEFDSNVVLFKGTSDTGQLMPYSLRSSILSVEPLVRILKEHHVDALSTWDDFGIRSGDLSDVVPVLQKTFRKSGSHFVYGYLNNPDHLLHKNGCTSEAVRNWIKKTEGELQVLAETCPDTLFILTADHGFIDIEGRNLEDFPELMATMSRPPSIEPRALNIFLKPGKDERFLQEFQTVAGSSYRVFSKAEVLGSQLFGPPPYHPNLASMVGDYLAVATDRLTLFPNQEYMDSMIATHGGWTKEELTVPLIIWRT